MSLLHLGVIADDFTGATDVAGFLVANGVTTVQLIGVPPGEVERGVPPGGVESGVPSGDVERGVPPGGVESGVPSGEVENDVPRADLEIDAQAVVVSLKSRSCPAEQAVAESLAALSWLRARGCRQIYQKYCSTFDSTPRGNIGPVADALMDELGAQCTVICPALPVNGRTVYNGYLFVNGVLLEESGMRNHPTNPMTDSHLGRLMAAQSRGETGLVTFEAVEVGAEAVAARLDALRTRGVRYAVLDALGSHHLDALAKAVCELPLVTGGSGLAASIARTWTGRVSPEEAAAAGRPSGGPAVVLSGSCSEMTRSQVAAYSEKAPSAALDAERCLDDPAYAEKLAGWVRRSQSGQSRQSGRWAPLVYATTDPSTLHGIHERFGSRAGEAVERTFATVARLLAETGTRRFVVAGGETSGAVVQALDVRGFHVGPQIAPGVPWVRSIEKPYSMALKSGNFGHERFFFDCQEDQV